MFTLSNEDVFETAKDRAAITIKYAKGDVYYLLSQRGQAIEIHIYIPTREGKLLIREATKAVIEWVKDAFPDCKMLIAPVQKKSVYNMCVNVGFEDLGVGKFENSSANVMVVKYG